MGSNDQATMIVLRGRVSDRKSEYSGPAELVSPTASYLTRGLSLKLQQFRAMVARQSKYTPVRCVAAE